MIGRRSLARQIYLRACPRDVPDVHLSFAFNLYRSMAAGGSRIRLNEDLIPTQHPGRPTGAEYTWLDSSAVPGTFYYYWLEDIDTNGAAILHGPVSLTLPGAVPGYRAFLPIMRK